MAALEELGPAVLDPVMYLIRGVGNALPGIVGGIIVLLVGYIVAVVVAAAVRKVLRRVDFNRWVVDRTGLKRVAGGLKATELASLITKWSVFALFFAPAADLFRLAPLSDFLRKLAEWIPNAILALLVVLFGLIAAEYLSHVIQGTRVKGVKVFADLTKLLVWFLTGLVALQQVGLQVDVIQNSFLIILSGVVFGVSLAIGLGFGLGLKREAERLIGKAKRRF